MKRKILTIALLSSLLIACQKQKDDEQYDCGPVPMCANIQCVAFLSNFNFTIVDKTTGTDLLFGNNPTLTPADIKLFIKSNSPYTQVTALPDQSTKAIKTIFGSDTMAIQIKNEPLKFIAVKNFCSPECCSRTAVEILYEGTLLVADDQKVIRIKR